MQTRNARDVAGELLVAVDQHRDEIVNVLQRFGAPALRYARDARIVVATLLHGERYDQRSPMLRRVGIDVDAWPAPPAGLFVVEERTIYLRSCTPMTIAHEFGHALDCALGGGLYHSSFSTRVRRLYSQAHDFVTPYAATSVDEYFAECVRAYVGVNDRTSYWPAVSRARLRTLDPSMYEYLRELFRDFRCVAKEAPATVHR